MRRHFLILFSLALCVQVWAASVTTPANLPAYYSSYIDNKSGTVLFSGIHDVSAVGFSSLSYAGVWVAYKTTDTKSDGTTIYDYYSYCSNYTYYSSQDGQAAHNNNEGDCYNREHSIPKSWFGGSTDKNTPGTDLFHLVPADKIVNSLRNNHPYGEVTVANATSKTQQGCGTRENEQENYNRYGTGSAITISNTIISDGPTTASPSVKVFEPLEEYKGDLARGYFGTLIKWAGDYAAFTTGDGSEIFSGVYTAAGKYGLTSYGIALLLKWHREDPVSQREIDRNNGIQATQGNRNPFIDYPILAEYIWGKYYGETFLLENAVGSFEEDFVVDVSDGDKNGTPPATTYSITWSVENAATSNQVEENTQPTAPSVDDCSADRVFVGWTTSSTVTSKPEVLYQSNEIPNATASATYYAVFADKETTGGSQAITQFIYRNNGYTNGEEVATASQDDVTINFDKGTNSYKPTYYDTGEAIRCYGANTITVSSTNVTQIVFTFASGESTNTISVNTGSYNADTKTWKGAADQVIFTIDGTSGHRRIKEMDVTSGSGSTTTYSNYSLYCSDPDPVTVTFMNNVAVYEQITDYPGTSISVDDPSACDGYTFYGWSTYLYDTDNTDEPIVTTPTIIPAEDETYYAVYTSSEEGEGVLTDNYRKITTTSELTNANYLIVADTGSLVAMSSTFKSTYYLAPSLVEEEDGVISTTADSIIWQFTTGNNQLSFTSATKGNFYIQQSINGDKTYYNIKLGNNTTDNKFSYSVNDGVWVLTSVSYPAQQLEFYRSQARWAFYSSQDAPVYLYKQVTEKETTTYYTTDPSCQSGPATELETREVTTAPKCILMEGNIFILREGKLYNLQGIRVR